MRNKWCLPKGKMLMFGLADIGLPEVHTIGVRNLRAAAPPLIVHGHPGRIEIKHVISGERYYLMNGREYRLRGNDVLVTYPGEIHGSGAKAVRIGIQYWLALTIPEKPQPFLGLAADEAWTLVSALKNLPVRNFKAHPHLRGAFEEILDQHRNATAKLKKTWVAVAVLNWLRLVIESAHAGAKSNPPERDRMPESPGIQAVLAAFQRDPEHPYTINEMAELSGFSVSRFKARFREELGVPPMQYVLRKKLEHAEALLKAGHNVTDVAYRLNFSSSQYFATVFRRHFGKSPRETVRRRIKPA